MRPHNLAFRLAAATALTGILCGAVAPAYAQAPGPQIAAPQAQIPNAGDPPARVGRLARIGGTVSFHTADADHWEPATLNEPVTSGNAFWTQPGSSADIDIGGGRVALDQASEFSIDQLDDTTFLATASQGRAYVRIRQSHMGETNTIRTPRGTVVLGGAGAYEITVGDTQTPTQVTVVEGAATITGPGVSLSIGEHQTAQITGSDDNFSGIVTAGGMDPFLSSQLASDAPPPVAANMPPPPPVVQQMTGYDSVASTGVWDNTPDYGEIWYPPVEADWAPYRYGRWAFVAPWGWTWIDDAPWGFAPFHYGRWVEWRGRWGWVPVAPGVAVYGRPVYAPALVTFVGAAAGVAIGIGIGAAVGWIPLGPREPYRPPYRVSETYLRQVNVTHVTNITNINNFNNAPGNYVNARGATMASAGAMQSSQSLRGVARPVEPGQLSSFHSTERPGVTPTTATQGVTPGVAHSLNLPTSSGAPVRTAPGPSFQPHPSPALAGGSAPIHTAPLVPQVPQHSGFAAPGGNATPSPHPAPSNGLPPMTVHGAPPAPSQPGAFGHPAPGGQAPGGQFQGGQAPGGQNPGGQPGAPGGFAPHQTAPLPNASPQPQLHPPAPTFAPVQQQQQFHQPTPTPAPSPTPVPQPQFHQPAPTPSPAPQPQFHQQAPMPSPAPQPQFHQQAPTPAPQPAPVFHQPPPQPHIEQRPAPAPQPQHFAPPAPPPAPQQHEQHHACPPGQRNC